MQARVGKLRSLTPANEPRKTVGMPKGTPPEDGLRFLGFASPAEDFAERPLDLHRHLVPRPSATFFFRAEGTGLEPSGIHPGDLLVVDRSLRPRSGDIVIAVVDGEFVVRRLRRRGKTLVLETDDPQIKPIRRTIGEEGIEIWGVVLHVIHSFRKT